MLQIGGSVRKGEGVKFWALLIVCSNLFAKEWGGIALIV